MTQYPHSPELSDLSKINFRISSKKLPDFYISNIPEGLNLISIYEGKKPSFKGISNGFKFYIEDYQYISARFNLNDFAKIDTQTFILKIQKTFSTLQYLNNRPIGALETWRILKHIEELSNYVFNVKEMYIFIRKTHYNPSLVKIKKRDYRIVEEMVFKTRNGFINALNEARKTVNSKYNLENLLDLLNERFMNNDFYYLDEIKPIGHKNNNLLTYAIIRKFNILCNGYQKKPREKKTIDPLYNINSIKELTVKSLLLKPQQRNAYIQRGKIKREKELKKCRLLTKNRKQAKQLLLILSDLTGRAIDVKVESDQKAQNLLKADLMNMVNKSVNSDTKKATLQFNENYTKPINSYMPLIYDLSNIFETDLSKSIFNQVSVQEAIENGDVFFKEFNRYHENKNNAEH